jgi:hypothetical protein
MVQGLEQPNEVIPPIGLRMVADSHRHLHRVREYSTEQDMSDDRVTTGEIYRLCQRIEKAVMLQNGRVRKLEEDAIRIKTVWSAGAFVVVILGDWLKHKLGL